MKLKDVEKVLYFESFLVIEPGLTKLNKNQLLSEEEYIKHKKNMEKMHLKLELEQKL